MVDGNLIGAVVNVGMAIAAEKAISQMHEHYGIEEMVRMAFQDTLEDFYDFTDEEIQRAMATMFTVEKS